MKAAIFDFNGTLFDDTNYHIEAWQNFLKKRFSLEMSREEIKRICIGPSNMNILRGISGGRLSEAELHALSLEKEGEYRAAVRSHPERMRLIDGAPEMFDALQARGVPFALATASEMDNVRFYLEDLGLARWFDMERIVYEEGKLASKPDPAFYLEAARRLKLHPGDCLIVEDSLTGIEAAQRAGAGRIVAMDRSVPRDVLERDERVYAVIHDFRTFGQFI